MPRLQLWSWKLSPYSAKVRAAFAEKGVELELLEIHPVRRPPALKEVNPFFRVPVLLVDGTPIRESSAICEWLEETHPQPALWPADPLRRAQLRAWSTFLERGPVQDLFFGLRKQTFGKDPSDPDDIAEQLLGRVPRAWRRTEAALGEADGPWLGGGQLTFADLTALPLAVRIAEWTPQLQPDPGDHPLTAAWLQALRDRPSAAQVDAEGPERLAAPKPA
jgi:glutathione S-transferase